MHAAIVALLLCSGTQQRATDTCIGDTANLAARLEGHTKLMGPAILLDGAARTGLGDRFAPDAMGPVVFMGKSEAAEVFALGRDRPPQV